MIFRRKHILVTSIILTGLIFITALTFIVNKNRLSLSSKATEKPLTNYESPVTRPNLDTIMSNIKNITGEAYIKAIESQTGIPQKEWFKNDGEALFYKGKLLKSKNNEDSDSIILKKIYVENTIEKPILDFIIEQVESAWEKTSERKIIAKNAEIIFFDPQKYKSSDCKIISYKNNETYILPDQVCENYFKEKQLAISNYQKKKSMRGFNIGQTVWIKLPLASSIDLKSLIKRLVKHEYGHQLGMFDSDVVEIRKNEIFDYHGKEFTIYDDIMYSASTANSSNLTDSIINGNRISISNLSFLKDRSLYFKDLETHNEKYYLYGGIAGPPHYPGQITPKPICEGYTRNNMISLSDCQEFFDGQYLYATGFILIDKGSNKYHKTSFDILDLLDSYYANKYTVALKTKPILIYNKDFVIGCISKNKDCGHGSINSCCDGLYCNPTTWLCSGIIPSPTLTPIIASGGFFHPIKTPTPTITNTPTPAPKYSRSLFFYQDNQYLSYQVPTIKNFLLLFEIKPDCSVNQKNSIRCPLFYHFANFLITLKPTSDRERAQLEFIIFNFSNNYQPRVYTFNSTINNNGSLAYSIELSKNNNKLTLIIDGINHGFHDREDKIINDDDMKIVEEWEGAGFSIGNYPIDTINGNLLQLDKYIGYLDRISYIYFDNNTWYEYLLIDGDNNFIDESKNNFSPYFTTPPDFGLPFY